MYESEDKMVSHPDHYQSGNGLEVIDVIEAFTADLTGIEAVCVGNALKYTCRFKKKNGAQDVKKAIWYLTRLLEKLEKTEEVKEPVRTKHDNARIPAIHIWGIGNHPDYLMDTYYEDECPSIFREDDDIFIIDTNNGINPYIKKEFRYEIVKKEND